jgi:hypothetical protein
MVSVIKIRTLPSQEEIRVQLLARTPNLRGIIWSPVNIVIRVVFAKNINVRGRIWL